MTLDLAQRGQKLKILDIKEPRVKAQAIRFGIFEGETVFCSEIIPAGPIIIRKHTQEIAIGRGLARLITVASATK
jgi:Fe2+ transport system protein FeoA